MTFYKLSFLCLNSYKSVVCGDFNFDILMEPIGRHTREYVQLFNSCGYDNLINEYTYVSPISHMEVSCLDHIWKNFPNEDSYGYVLRPNMSDHFAVCAIIQLLKSNFETFLNQTLKISSLQCELLIL